MLDVEYISELTIALLNGHQNKKDKLDYYYVLYESEYSDGENVETVFDKVCNELVQVLPEIKKIRWSRMIDFYTLFLVMSDAESKLPLAQDKRDTLRDKLVHFGGCINAYQKRLDEEKAEFSGNVIQYASGIRNSSDLNARKNRYAALKNELSL